MITKDHEPAAATSSAPSIGDVAARMPAERLEAEIVSRAQMLARGTYELLVHVAELDARGTWATWGALSCAAWLADACDLDPATANSHVRVARALRAHPVVAEALRAGQLSYSKVRALCPHLTDANAEQLVALARSVPAAALGRAIAGWSREHEDPEDVDARHRRDRSLRWRTDSDGMITITARLPPHQAAPVLAVIDQRVMSDRAPAGASLAQQRADALGAVAAGGGATVVAEVVIHVDGSATHLVDGTPISEHAVAGLLPDAFVSLLLYDAHRYPIDASPRRRTPTRRQRRVVDARHPECSAEGCHARTLLQHDHIDPYAGGGPTVVDNLTSCEYARLEAHQEAQPSGTVRRPLAQRSGSTSPSTARRASSLTIGSARPTRSTSPRFPLVRVLCFPCARLFLRE